MLNLGIVASGVNVSGWDSSSPTFNQFFSVTAQDSGLQDVFFKPDGTTMYIIGLGGDSVYEYSLSSAWNVSSASFVRSKNIGAQDTTPTGLFFKSDGTKMYVVGVSNPRVYEYDLSTAWDVTTATFIQSFPFGGQDVTPTGVYISDDGLHMYMTGASQDRVNEYGFGIAWDVSTAFFVRFFSVATQETFPTGVFFKPDGARMFVCGNVSDSIHQYDLSTPWDISTAVFSDSTSLSAQDTAPEGIHFKPDGTKMYMAGGALGRVNEYDL